MSAGKQDAGRRRLFALLGMLGLQGEQERGELALQYSGGRTSRLSELTQQEQAELARGIEEQARALRPAKPRAGGKMRSKVLHLATRAGLLPPARGRKLERHEFERFNQWMGTYATLKKPLWEYADKELPALISQLERVAAWREDKNAGEDIRAMLATMGISLQSDNENPKKTHV